MLARFRGNSDNLKNSLQIRETGFGELRPPPSSPAEPGIFLSGSNRRLCRDFRYRFGPLSSLREFVVSGGDFGGFVSVSKNSVPGGLN